MTPKEILIQAKALIENPENWTQGAYARDDQGHARMPGEAGATCFCAMGALYHVCWGPLGVPESEQVAAQDLLVRGAGCRSIPSMNDGLGWCDPEPHAAVLALYDEAIARA